MECIEIMILLIVNQIRRSEKPLVPNIYKKGDKAHLWLHPIAKAYLIEIGDFVIHKISRLLMETMADSNGQYSQ